jgi:diguanylate cyclase (GGDEF)-like protein
VNLVLLDLDDFKAINDTFGHPAGDRILRDIGALFLARTRRGDLVARYGGDEFIMLVSDLGPAEVTGMAQRVVTEISSIEWTFDGTTFCVNVAAGVACSQLLDQTTIAQLLAVADRDLYKTKWVRKHPDLDPSLYEYDTTRQAQVVEFMREHTVVRRIRES